MNNDELKKRLRLSCLIIVVAGLCGAMLIYLLAEDVPDDSQGYVIVNGTVYPGSTRDSKKYQIELERIGGKQALLFNDLTRWFSGHLASKASHIPINCHAALSRRHPPHAAPDSKPPAPSSSGPRLAPPGRARRGRPGISHTQPVNCRRAVLQDCRQRGNDHGYPHTLLLRLRLQTRSPPCEGLD